MRRAAPILLCLLLAATSFGLYACVRVERVRPPEPAAPPVYKGRVAVEQLKGAYVFGGMDTLKSQVNVKVRTEEESLGTFKGVFAYMSPDLMRLRLFGPVGMDAVELLASGTLVQFYVPNKKTIYEGRAAPFAIPREARFSVVETPDGYTLYAFRPGGSMELLGEYSFDRSLRQVGMVVYKDRQKLVEVEFGDYSGRLPGAMKFSFFNGYVMDMTLVGPVVDSDIPREYFSPLRHEGRKVLPITLSAGGP
ncbi:MAG: hypothetical protein Kow0025_19630 [Thermodesulfovibrionales bacterium]